MKSIEDVKKLVKDWNNYPCFDIEEAEGFEEYKDFLRMYRLLKEFLEETEGFEEYKDFLKEYQQSQELKGHSNIKTPSKKLFTMTEEQAKIETINIKIEECPKCHSVQLSINTYGYILDCNTTIKSMLCCYKCEDCGIV